MQINIFNIYRHQNNPKQSHKNCFGFKLLTLNKDTVSFSKRRDINAELKSLPADAFPSEGLRNFILQGLESNENTDIVTLHREYYSQLLDCETLEDAKKLYPEFQNVIDAKDIDLSSYSGNNTFKQIQRGKFVGLTLENLSITLLKKYYAELIPDSNEGIKNAINMNHQPFHNLLTTLNIQRDKRYSKLLGLRMQHDAIKRTSQTPEYKRKHSEALKASYANNPELLEKRREIQKRNWQNPEYREKTLTAHAKAVKTEEYSKKQHIHATNLWQNEEYKQIRSIVDFASHLAWEMHPQAKQLYKEMAKEFPDLAQAINKRRRKEPLTERERQVNLLYFKACNENFPNIKREVAEIQKSLLSEWGFYDKNRDIEKMLEIIEKLKNSKTI